jgi:Transglutaminase elicitor
MLLIFFARRNVSMQAAAVSLLLVAASLAQPGPSRRPGPPPRFFSHGPINKDELEQQQQAFKQWWGDEYKVKLADLPVAGKVPDFRIPYAGHDYPDRGGGTLVAMYKYDQAFHRSRTLAADFERLDISAHRSGRPPSRGEPPREGAGLFARLRANAERGRVPTWYGHCNGWTAAAIRHAEPQQSVVRNGVTFSPADIKGLLAEIYMYADSEFLGGLDPAINPGVLHLTLANWLGRGSHPLGMETAVGEVVVNFPIFNYQAVITNLSPREAEVKTTITYTLNTNREQDQGPPKFHRQMHFHYALDLDEGGSIRGGRFFGDSAQIDMLWAPLKPVQGGEEGNKRGNPHLSIQEVLSIWRESVPADLRQQWLNIDPTEEDRIMPPAEAIASTAQPATASEVMPIAAAASADTQSGNGPAATAESSTATGGPVTGEAAPSAAPVP